MEVFKQHCRHIWRGGNWVHPALPPPPPPPLTKGCCRMEGWRDGLNHRDGGRLENWQRHNFGQFNPIASFLQLLHTYCIYPPSLIKSHILSFPSHIILWIIYLIHPSKRKINSLSHLWRHTKWRRSMPSWFSQFLTNFNTSHTILKRIVQLFQTYKSKFERDSLKAVNLQLVFNWPLLC